MTTIPAEKFASLGMALPFWLSLGTIPVALIALWQGGLAVLLLPAYTWGLYSILDAITGNYTENADTETPLEQMFWYRLITLIWFPIQFILVFGMIWVATHTPP